jgi:hypothetical protein
VTHTARREEEEVVAMVMDRQQPGKVAAALDIAEAGLGDRPDLDDDGREKRTGMYILPCRRPHMQGGVFHAC